jgi:hypothetical protein
LISLGGEHFTFGTFKEMEIKDIYRPQLNETSSVAFNKYGTNQYKYKYDPLVVIEAKFAMTAESSKEGEQVATETEKMRTMEGEEKETEELRHTQEHPSHEVGTQEAPLRGMSSHEEGNLNRTRMTEPSTKDLGHSGQTVQQTRRSR